MTSDETWGALLNSSQRRPAFSRIFTTQNFQDTAAMVMAGVSWDSEGVIHTDFLPLDVTINAQYCSNMDHRDV